MKTTQKSENHSKKWKPLKKSGNHSKKWKPLKKSGNHFMRYKQNLEDYMKIEIHSLQETQEFATKMADLCRNKQLVITLDGDLGAGKTTWTKSFGKALGVKNVINSPTFTILKDYKQEGGGPFHHIDAYRLEGKCQDLGFEDCFDEGITVVEWSEFIEDQLHKIISKFLLKKVSMKIVQ